MRKSTDICKEVLLDFIVFFCTWKRNNNKTDDTTNLFELTKIIEKFMQERGLDGED